MANTQILKFINNDPYLYQENAAGTSQALGIDSVDNKFKISVTATPGAVPSSFTQLTIDPSINGNIILTPNGSGLAEVAGSASILGALGIGAGLSVSSFGAGVIQANSSGIFASTQGTDGQLLIGATGLEPSWNGLTSVTGTIAITTAPHGISLDATSPSFITNSGTAFLSGNQLHINGGSNTSTTGSGNIVTINLINSPSVTGSITAATGLIATAGGITATGTSNINTSGSAVTTIGTGGTGAVNIGNTTGNTTVTGYLTTGSILLASTTVSGSQGVIAINGNSFLSAYNGTSGVGNTWLGDLAGSDVVTSGSNNTGIGKSAAQSITSGIGNVAVGRISLNAATSGNESTALGSQSLENLTTGSHNVACGWQALQNSNGSYNAAFGYQAGLNLTSTDSNNVYLQNTGTLGDSNIMRLGQTGSGNGQVNKTFVAAIAGVTVSSAAAVQINTSTGQLGTVVSSRRFKDNIESIDESLSGKIYALNPVSFTYKNTEPEETEYGLIAEEVAEILPDFVIYDDNGDALTVKYQNFLPLILKELQRLNEINSYQRVRITVLEEKIRSL